MTESQKNGVLVLFDGGMTVMAGLFYVRTHEPSWLVAFVVLGGLFLIACDGLERRS